MTPLVISLAMAAMAVVTGVSSVLAFRWHRRWKAAMAVIADWQETIPALERERVIAVTALNAATRRIDELEAQHTQLKEDGHEESQALRKKLSLLKDPSQGDSRATVPILDAQEAAAPTVPEQPAPVLDGDLIIPDTPLEGR